MNAWKATTNATNAPVMRTGVRARALRLVASAAGIIALASVAPSQDAHERAVVELALNIPAFRLDVFVDGARAESYRVATGSRTYPTPVGNFEITSIEWNPWWNPPERTWTRGAVPLAPGPQNPMGRAKLQFLPLYYVHGTPDTLSIGKPLSHGCIRLADKDAIALAQLVLRHAEPALGAREIERLSTHAQTARIELTRAVPFRVLYEIAEVRDDTLRVYPDVYRRERRAMYAVVMSALSRAGVDTAQLDARRVRQFVDGVRRGSSSQALAAFRTQ